MPRPRRNIVCTHCTFGKRGKYPCSTCRGTGWIVKLPKGEEEELAVVRHPRNGKLYYSPEAWVDPASAVVARNREWKFVPWASANNFNDWSPGEWDIVPESQVFSTQRNER